VLPIIVGVRDSAVHLVSVLGSAVTSLGVRTRAKVYWILVPCQAHVARSLG
jgi:hypothetical protein